LGHPTDITNEKGESGMDRGRKRGRKELGKDMQFSHTKEPFFSCFVPKKC